MSKLFDTLEQIRKNEAAQIGGPKDTPISIKKKKGIKNRTLTLILIPALLVAGIYISLPYLSSFFQKKLTRVATHEQSNTSKTQPPPVTSKPVAPAKPQVATVTQQLNQAKQPLTQKTRPAVDPVKSAASKQTTADMQQFIAYNNKGTNLISNEQYWEGINYLNKAYALQPNRVEPLINIGVALAELGLFGPASRYLKKALEIAPNNEKVIENINVLTQVGLLDMAM